MDQNHLIISGEDTGCGVDPTVQPLLFNSVVEPSQNGTGIGLYTVREKAAALGGACGHGQLPSGGSKFWVSVPFRLPTSQAPA